MKKLILTACALTLGAVFSFSAIAQEKTLGQIHGAAWPQSQNGYVTKYQCMTCHGTYDQMAARTANLEPNPHMSHLGQVNCEECHLQNASSPQPMCMQCHQFEFKQMAQQTPPAAPGS